MHSIPPRDRDVTGGRDSSTVVDIRIEKGREFYGRSWAQWGLWDVIVGKR